MVQCEFFDQVEGETIVELDLPLELLNALLSIKRVDLFNEVNTFLGTYAVLDMVVFLKRPFYRVLVYAEKAGNES
jgi:hypothetical protein